MDLEVVTDEICVPNGSLLLGPGGMWGCWSQCLGEGMGSSGGRVLLTVSGPDNPEGDFLQDVHTGNSQARQDIKCFIKRVQNSSSLSFNILSLIR